METSWKQDRINYPANAETRNMIEQAILAEYEKVVTKSEQVSSERK
jgi:DNA-binding cell septation regulator SpoVG